MNKTSNVAFELAQDIYNLCGEVDTLFETYGNHQISAQVFYKKLYVCACEVDFLEGVIKSLRSEGYKFIRYNKEIELLSISSKVSIMVINFTILETGMSWLELLSYNTLPESISIKTLAFESTSGTYSFAYVTPIFAPIPNNIIRLRVKQIAKFITFFIFHLENIICISLQFIY